tara:strand:+ start:649 stop:1404 length:756 start_codon:yes stop_codon:yes gene_type:complete
MAALGSQSIASSYEQLLHVDRDGGGNGTTLVSVKDGDNGTTFDIQLSSNSTNFQTDFQIGGTAVSSTAAELNLLDGSSDANSTVSKAVILNSSGNIALPNGKGIDFAATANSSGTMSSELFDDYEEGTWTPVFRGSSGSAGSASTTNHHSSYTKIGRLVIANMYAAFSDKGSWGGNLEIAGLPFTGASVTNLQDSGSISTVTLSQWSIASQACIMVPNGQVYFILKDENTSVTIADVTAGATFGCTITYIT